MKVVIVMKEETEEALLRCHKSALALCLIQTNIGSKEIKQEIEGGRKRGRQGGSEGVQQRGGQR